MADFYSLQIKPSHPSLVEVIPPGGARIEFTDVRRNGQPDVEVYALAGTSITEEAFLAWVKQEFGYLRTKVTFSKRRVA